MKGEKWGTQGLLWWCVSILRNPVSAPMNSWRLAGLQQFRPRRLYVSRPGVYLKRSGAVCHTCFTFCRNKHDVDALRRTVHGPSFRQSLSQFQAIKKTQFQSSSRSLLAHRRQSLNSWCAELTRGTHYHYIRCGQLAATQISSRTASVSTSTLPIKCVICCRTCSRCVIHSWRPWTLNWIIRTELCVNLIDTRQRYNRECFVKSQMQFRPREHLILLVLKQRIKDHGSVVWRRNVEGLMRYSMQRAFRRRRWRV
jgi:hypothetical protein